MKKPITKLPHWTIVLDEKGQNDHYLNYLSNLSTHIEPDGITLLTVVQDSEIPSELLAELPNIHEPNLEELELEAKVIGSNYFSHITNVDFKLIDGDSTIEILKHCKNSGTDLLIAQNQQSTELPSTLKKFVRKAPCSVLFVPHKVSTAIQSILVPTDFSDHADLAVGVASRFQKEEKVDIHILHAYYDSSKYVNQVFETVYEADKYISKKVELDEKLAKHANHKLKKYIEEKGLSGRMKSHTIEISKGSDTGEILNKSISEICPDLLIIGAKGISRSAISLTGGVSETIYSISINQPTVIVKEDKENIGFLTALLNRNK